MDYISLNIVWIVANAVLVVLYKTILSEVLGSKQLFKVGNGSIPFLQAFDKADARQFIAIIIFIIFTIYTIKKYNRSREKDAIGMIITIILGIAQLYIMCTLQF